MKKKLSVLLITVIALMFTGATADSLVPLYGADGRITEVEKEEVSSYLENGYYKTRAEVYKTLYSMDGRTLTICLSEVETYKALGWYETKEEVIETLYSEDGRTLTVYKSYVDTYLALGWYKFEDMNTTLYTFDGRSLTIHNSAVDTYLKLGWYRYEDATTTLYADDGRTLTIFNCAVDTYLKLGWHRKYTPDPSKPIIAFTFDDGPHPSNTKMIVDTLKQYNSTATFFVLGKLAGAYPDVVKYAADNGMEIGNHSYNHARLTALSASSMISDVNSASANVYNAAGVYPKLLRPPYGALNDTVKFQSGLPIIMWSVDTLDWKSRNAVSVYNHILNNVKDGDIVLMHDIHPSTVEAVKMVVPELINRGFQIVSVSTLAEAKGYTITQGNRYSQFR